MSIPKTPLKIRSGATLPLSTINQNFDELANDIQDGFDQRYTYSSYTLRWDAPNAANTALRTKVNVAPPFYSEIVGLTFYGISANTVTLTLSCIDLDIGGVAPSGWQDVALTLDQSLTQLSTATDRVVALPANHRYQFCLTADTVVGTPVAHAWAEIEIRTDRGNAGDTFTSFTPPRIKAGDLVSAAPLNTAFSAVAAAVARDTAADKQMRVQIFMVSNASATRSFRLPLGQPRRLKSMKIGFLAQTTGKTSQWTLVDTGTVTTASISGTADSLLETDGTSGSLPHTMSQEGVLTFTPNVGGGHYLDYCILYWF